MTIDEMVEKAARAIKGASRKAMSDEDAAWLARAVIPLIEAAAFERAAKVNDDEAFAIEEDERNKRSWGGPDPRGDHAAFAQLATARKLRAAATAIRSLREKTDGPA